MSSRFSSNFGFVLAALFAIPSLLALICFLPIIALLSIPSVWILVRQFSRQSSSSSSSSSNNIRRRVVVTGGSSGIGLAIACHAATQSDVDEIIILARNPERLELAKEQIIIKQQRDDQKKKIIQAISVDVTQSEQIESIAESILLNSSSSNDKQELTTHLFCCAGEAHPSKFLEQSSHEYEYMVHLNQLGSMYTANAFLRRLTHGTVTLCSSMAGQVGVFGLAAYTPTKFALRGYAECVHMELLHHQNNKNVHIQMAFPPDVDTPGFARENITKPKETHLVSETAGLARPEDIGKCMYQEAIPTNPKFHVYFNFDGFLLCCITAGFSPVTTIFDAIAQVAVASFGRFIALLYLANWNRILNNYYHDQENEENPKKTSKNESDKHSTKGPPTRTVTDVSTNNNCKQD